MLRMCAKLGRKGAQEQLELGFEAEIADRVHLEGQSHDGGGLLGGLAKFVGRCLRQPHDPRVVTEVVVAEFGMSVEAEFDDDAAVE